MRYIIKATVLGLSLAVLGTTVSCAAAPTQESTGQYIDSSAVTTKVKTALLQTKGIDSSDISVETYKGVVQLSGFVQTQAQSQLAEQTAAQVQGVRQVQNNLIIRSSY